MMVFWNSTNAVILFIHAQTLPGSFMVNYLVNIPRQDVLDCRISLMYVLMSVSPNTVLITLAILL